MHKEQVFAFDKRIRLKLGIEPRQNACNLNAVQFINRFIFLFLIIYEIKKNKLILNIAYGFTVGIIVHLLIDIVLWFNTIDLFLKKRIALQPPIVACIYFQIFPVSSKQKHL